MAANATRMPQDGRNGAAQGQINFSPTAAVSAYLAAYAAPRQRSALINELLMQAISAPPDNDPLERLADAVERLVALRERQR